MKQLRDLEVKLDISISDKSYEKVLGAINELFFDKLKNCDRGELFRKIRNMLRLMFEDDFNHQFYKKILYEILSET